MTVSVLSIEAKRRVRKPILRETARLLSEERQIAADLQTKKLSYSQIASLMGITSIRARDLCRQHDRLQKLRARHVFEQELSKRAFNALVNGSYARRLTSERSERVNRLLEIAARYTPDELQDERSVGRRTFREIELWLAKRGVSLRSPTETIDDAVDRFRQSRVAYFGMRPSE